MTEEYEVALSFAGEDREFVEQVAFGLLRRRVKIFYDKFLQANLWGKDLYQYLFDVYSAKSRYCIVFISEYYLTKLWTRHEIRAAQSKDFITNIEYILPVRLDDSQLPGLPQTIGYLDARNLTAEEIVELVTHVTR